METVPRVCATCRFSITQRMDPTSLQRIRVCKKGPPTVALIQHQGQMTMRSLWPIVPDNEFCYSCEPIDSAAVNVPIEGVEGPKAN